MGYSLPGSSVHGILHARILEWVAMPFSRGSSQPRDRTCVSCSPALAGRSLTAVPPRKSSNADWRTLYKILDQDSSKLKKISKSTERQKQAQTREHKETQQMDAVWFLVGSWNRECIHGKAGKIQIRSEHFCLFVLACSISFPWLGIELIALALEVWSVNLWTTRQVPGSGF